MANIARLSSSLTTKVIGVKTYPFVEVNSVQEAWAKCFAVHILKFEIMQITWKNETKNIRLLVFSFSSINLALLCFVFSCFVLRFQILICEPRGIWRKLLLLSWLYMWRNILYFKSSVGCKLKTKINEKYFECYLHIHNFKFVINNLSIFLRSFPDRGNFLIAPTLAIDSGTPDQYYHHVVQGLLSHVGSQGNVRVCRYSKLLLQLYRAKNIISKNKESFLE